VEISQYREIRDQNGFICRVLITGYRRIPCERNEKIRLAIRAAFWAICFQPVSWITLVLFCAHHGYGAILLPIGVGIILICTSSAESTTPAKMTNSV
jgi:hypothetical protein